MTVHWPVQPNPRPDNQQRGQGTRLGPAPRAPRGLLHPRAVDGQGDRDRVGRCAPHPPSRARSGPAHMQYWSRPLAPFQPPHTCRLGSPPLPSPPRTPRSCPIRTTRPARQPVGLRRSLAAPLAATFEVAADGAANERVGPKRRRVFTIPEPYLSAGIFNATRGRSRPPPPPRRPPFTAASAAISAPIITATPLATTAPECATIDATLASMTTLSRRPARAGPTWHRHHRLHRRFPRPAAAAAVTPVAAIAPATILAATAGAAERCDV